MEEEHEPSLHRPSKDRQSHTRLLGSTSSVRKLGSHIKRDSSFNAHHGKHRRSTKRHTTHKSESVFLYERYSDYEGSDEDFEFPPEFDEAETRKALLDSPNCAKIVLSLESQREMGLEIGVHVTAEHPWKQVRLDVLTDYLPSDSPEAEAFRKKMRKFSADEPVLVGYAAALSEEEDVFLFFETAAAALEASVLIEQIEASERRKARRAQVKYPLKWKSLGSEVEVENLIKKKPAEVVEVEIQSLYPMGHSHKAFQMRLTTDARDGYVELVPRKPQDFHNVYRRRVDTFMQSAEPRVHLEQQTDPTFPANAWSQYLYEIGQDKVDEPLGEDDDEEPQRKKRGANVGPVIPVIPTECVDQLLESLEFNEVNMYRNDYQHISDKVVTKYKVPYMHESFCFVNLAKSLGRYVASIDWHPKYSGIVVASYTFSTSSTCVPINDKTDKIKRSVLQPNPVIMWCLDDTLHPKLELATAREITCIAFCPYDDELVAGGTINGQLVIWDLKGRMRKLESEEVLSPAQIKYQVAMGMFLDWTKQDEADRIVRPVVLSNLQHSHKAAITSIKWLGKDCYVASAGNLKVSRAGTYRYLATASLDCSIAFWDMDFVDEQEAKRPSGARKLKLPSHMVEKPSDYERLNKVFRPQFMVTHTQPITGMLMDGGVYKYLPLLNDLRTPRTQTTRVKHKAVPEFADMFDDRVLVGSLNGTVASLKWDGSELTVSDIIKRDSIKTPDFFAQVHDGSIQAIHRNPFLTDLFLTIGRNVLVLWRKDILWTPVFWRRDAICLTDVKWSKDRPAVFFVIRADGSFETWDLLSRTDAPCLVDSLGGEALTKLSQHTLSIATEVVAVGDFNSSLRFLDIPSCFSKGIPNEQTMLHDFIDHEIERKIFLKQWQTEYYESNADVRAARRQAAAEAQLEVERLEKEFKEQEEIRLRREENEARKAYKKLHNKAVFEMPEILERKWDESNIKRLTKKLMAMKQVDHKLLEKLTKMEKSRLKYCAKKRQAVEESFGRVSADMAELRAKLIPPEVVDEGRVMFVKENLDIIRVAYTEELKDFQDVDEEAMRYIDSNRARDPLDYAGILRRGRQRREVINMSLGANTEHRRTFYGGSVISKVSSVPISIEASPLAVASLSSALQGAGDAGDADGDAGE